MWVSWQTTVIGDPLYRPFAKPPEQLHKELELKQSKLTEWSFLRAVNLNEAAGRPLASLVSLLEQIPILSQSPVLMEKLADLYAEQGKPTSAIETYQRALTLTPSPEQRIRIRLTLGEKLIAAQRKDEAVEDFEKLLVEFPDYPGKDLVTHQLAALKPQPAGTNTVAKP
jgi:predicted Zn-dependent protease